ncbi:MAG: exodeoxyribonuclease VII large subunit, partial [Verrucomicrobiota bacterium]|nr:exodeoxyribonuclease VII large subunit [Verrucomicrobiota bacterium]
MKPPPEQVLEVTVLTRLIKGQLEEKFSRVWVKGEVSNLRKQSSGH